MVKYTVTCNHDEYAEGLFDTERQANAYRASKIRKEEPDVSDDMSIDEVLEFDEDGYYRVLEIAI